MKKILSIILLVCSSYLLRAQFSITQNLGSPNTLVKNPNYGGFQGGLIPFTFADTTAANLTNLKYYAGAYIYTSSPRATWWRDAAVSTWVQVLPGGGTGALGAWTTTLNTTIPTDLSLNGYFGTTDANGIGFYTTNTQRVILPAGGLTLKAVVSDTTLNKPMVWNTSTKEWNYAYWYGGSGATPTWQQTLTAGSTLTGANTIQMGGNSLIFHDAVGNNDITFSADDDTYINVKSPLGGTTAGVRLRNGSTLTAALESDGADVALSSTNSGHLQFSDQLNYAILDLTTGIGMHPYTGLLTIDTLNNTSAQNNLMGWVSTAGADRGKVGYITVGSGLSLSSGALTSTAGSLTATYIGYGSAGNALTGSANNTWTAATNIQTIDSGILKFSGSATLGDAGTGAIYKNSTYGLTMRGITGAAYDWLLFDVAGNAVLANHTGTTTFGTSGMFGAGLLGGTISATMHLKAGSTAASSAPLKFNSGSLMTTAEAGAVEFLTDKWYATITTGAARKELTLNDAALTSGRVPYVTTNGRLTDVSNFTFDGSQLVAPDIQSATGISNVATDAVFSFNDGGTTSLKISGSGSDDIIYYNSGTTHNFQTGTVTMGAYGAGAATFDASGNITSVSDMRLKDLQGMYEVGINRVLQITPIVYKWNEKSKLERNHNYIGFSAQNVKDALGENAIGINKDGYYSLQDRAILAAVVNGEKDLYNIIQQQQKQIDELKKAINKLKK